MLDNAMSFIALSRRHSLLQTVIVAVRGDEQPLRSNGKAGCETRSGNKQKRKNIGKTMPNILPTSYLCFVVFFIFLQYIGIKRSY